MTTSSNDHRTQSSKKFTKIDNDVKSLVKKKKKKNLKIHDIDLKVTSIVNIRKISIPYISQFVKRVKVIVEKHSEISKVLLLKCFSKKIRQLGKVYKKLF